MPLSGYTTPSLPNDILLDSGILYLGNTLFGVSRGGLKFDPAREFRNIEFDGKRAPIVGLDRIIKTAPVITGKFLEFGPGDIPNHEPGATSTFASATSPTGVITPKKAGVMLVTGDYLTNLRLVFERAASGMYVQVRFPKAFCSKYTLAGTDAQEAEVDATFEARLDMSASGATTSDVPYVIEGLAALP